MPDTYGLGNRPVVRKLSATSNDLFKKFGERTTSSSADSSNLVSPSASSSGTTTPSLLRSRPGSIKKVRTKAEVSRRSGQGFICIYESNIQALAILIAHLRKREEEFVFG